MPSKIKSLTQMNSDSLRFLADHTSISYLAEGSIARALVETTNLEIAKLSEYISSVHSEGLLDSATGPHLNLIGKMFGVMRVTGKSAAVAQTDKNIKISTVSGRLGDSFPDPGNSNQGRIPSGFVISTADGAIKFKVPQHIHFDRSLREIFVPAIAEKTGEAYNVGANRLVSHSGPTSVNVTNTKAINNGFAVEPDSQYRYRIANNLASSPTGNALSIRMAAMGDSDIADVKLRQYARGAGTFDALLVPVANTISFGSKDRVRRAVESVSAFGVNPRVIEPDYMTFKVVIQFIRRDGDVLPGVLEASRESAVTAILDYFETIPIGGELIINRLRSAIMGNLSPSVKDIKILELCLGGRPHMIRNFKLKKDQVFIPDNGSKEGPITLI
jgi:uncharacterized phage protein gp47/JayE